MPGLVKLEPPVLDVADVIRLLVGMRKEQFEHEAAVRLFQFQTWILNSQDMSLTATAGQIAATQYLENIRRPGFYSKTNEERFSSAALTRLFENETYRALFDAVIARYGGWTNLVEVSTNTFEQQIADLRVQAATTTMMMDYLFRCQDHEEFGTFGKPAPPPKYVANISHAMFYVYKIKKPISGKTIRNRWRLTKQSSVFIYASKLLGSQFDTAFLGPGFLAKLTADAKNGKRNKQFFGVCRWIAEMGIGDVFDEQAALIPDSVAPVRPATSPLSEREMKLMDLYKAEYQMMRDA